MINLYEFSFNNFAGKLNVQQFADGKYPYRMGYNGGSSGNVHQRITISDKVYEYAKKTINLHEKFPSYFNEDGTHDMDVFGVQRNFSFAEDSTSTKQTAGICFLSGNLITAPIPDKNGNVTIYVNKEDYSFTLMTDFGWESGGGGGITGIGGYADSKAVFSFSTPSVPENGFALKKLPVGEYTVKSVDLPEKYEAYTGTLTISDEPGSGVPECRIVTEIKKRAVNIAESKYGTVKVSADDTSKIPAESVVKFEAVPEEGYRITGLKCTDENGNDVEISDDNTFTMPYTSVTVEASFAEIVKGDVNGDGKINAQDILWEVNMITGYTEAPDKGWTDAADINGDGQLNIFDYIRLIKKITAF